jgi:hypothetical protein
VIGVEAPPNYDRLAGALRTWSEFHVRPKRKPPAWDSAHLLVQGAKILDHYAQQYLQDALARSDVELSPLAEPLKLNLGEHRWLSADREESYSDWLAWILQGISDSTEILRLFALSDDANGELPGPVGKIRREVWSEHGRTDIEVPIGKRALLLIEVKVQNTGSELPSQLERYAQKVTDQHVERALLVLLGTEAPEPNLPLFEFKFTDWRTLCQRLRRHANRIKSSDLLRAAAILIFCGAAEQNLLGFSGRPRRLRAMATVDYLHEWRCEDEQRRLG